MSARAMDITIFGQGPLTIPTGQNHRPPPPAIYTHCLYTFMYTCLYTQLYTRLHHVYRTSMHMSTHAPMHVQRHVPARIACDDIALCIEVRRSERAIECAAAAAVVCRIVYALCIFGSVCRQTVLPTGGVARRCVRPHLALALRLGLRAAYRHKDRHGHRHVHRHV